MKNLILIVLFSLLIPSIFDKIIELVEYLETTKLNKNIINIIETIYIIIALTFLFIIVSIYNYLF